MSCVYKSPRIKVFVVVPSTSDDRHNRPSACELFEELLGDVVSAERVLKRKVEPVLVHRIIILAYLGAGLSTSAKYVYVNVFLRIDSMTSLNLSKKQLYSLEVPKTHFSYPNDP